jgi:hypothetical protein
MALGNLHQWIPALTHIDPRPQDKISVGAKYCVVSVSRYPTFNELAQSPGGTIANTKMVGLIQSFAAPQARPIFRLFEMGSRYPYTVAGKFMGTIALTSMMFDAGANLLGGIYEEVFTDKQNPNSYALTNTGQEIINHPQLFDPDNPAGSEVPVLYDMRSVGGSVGGPSKDWGAIRMSLDDNRLDVPFGLVFTIFQSGKRIKANAQTGEGGLNVEIGDENRYRIMSCLFFEMVRVQAYDFQVTAEQEVLYESASFYYHGLVNVKTTAKADTGSYSSRTGYDPGNV